MTVTGQPLTLEHRRTALQNAISGYVRNGFQVLSQSDTDAHLAKQKRISCFWVLVFIFIGWIILWLPLFVYIIWYWSRGDKQVYLIVDEYGNVGHNAPPANRMPAQPRQPSPSTILPGVPDNLILGGTAAAALLGLLVIGCWAIYVFGGA